MQRPFNPYCHNFPKHHCMPTIFTRIVKAASLLLVPVLLFSSCKKDKDPQGNPSITKTWVFEKYENDIAEYSAASQLNNEKAGYIFKSNGQLVERANSGWCGTPPIAYSNYDGKWNLVNDSKIDIKGKFWGGDKNYGIEIVSVTASTLRIKYIY